MYSEAGATECKWCWHGHYQPLPGQSACLVVTAGYYTALPDGRPGPVTKQTICPAGTYTPYDGYPASSCLPCYDGKWQPLTGQTSCIPSHWGYAISASPQPNPKLSGHSCPDGTYAPEGSNACIMCPAGQYTSVWVSEKCHPAAIGRHVPEIGMNHDIQCPEGSFTNETGMATCIKASKGYIGSPDRTSQIPCSKGMYQSETGKTECSWVRAGYYVPDDGLPHVTPIPCPDDQTSGLLATKCSLCPSGAYIDTATKLIVLAQNGKYQPLSGQSFAQLTSPGYYTSTLWSGNIIARHCPAGTIASTRGQAACTPCNAGKYQPAVGSTACINADPGYIVPADNKPHTTQTACGAGTVPNAQKTGCVAGTTPMTFSPSSVWSSLIRAPFMKAHIVPGTGANTASIISTAVYNDGSAFATVE